MSGRRFPRVTTASVVQTADAELQAARARRRGRAAAARCRRAIRVPAAARSLRSCREVACPRAHRSRWRPSPCPVGVSSASAAPSRPRCACGHFPGAAGELSRRPRAGARLGELHVEGDRLGWSRAMFSITCASPCAGTAIGAQFVEGGRVDLDQHDVRGRGLGAADREARVDGAQLQRAQRVGLVGDDRRAPRRPRQRSQQEQAPQALCACRSALPPALRAPSVITVSQLTQRALTWRRTDGGSTHVRTAQAPYAGRPLQVQAPISSGAMGAVYRA